MKKVKKPQECKSLQELFADEDRWTTDNFAENDCYEAVSIHDPTATCWCLDGGLQLVYPGPTNKGQREKARRAIVRAAIDLGVVDEYQAHRLRSMSLAARVTTINDEHSGGIHNIQRIAKEANV